jgi:hypothetical protein
MEQLRDSVEIIEDFTPRRPTAPVNHIIQHPAPAAADPVTASFSLPGPKGPITTQILPTAPVTVGFSTKEAKPAIASITQHGEEVPALMSLPPSVPPYTSGYAPTETTPSLGTSYFSAGAPPAPTDWYLYPALPVPPATGGAVLFVDGSGQHVLESIDGNLYFDTELLAKAGDIQDVADWSLYPALATVDVNGETIDVVGKLSFQTAVAGGAGLIENAQLISGDSNVPFDIATTGTGTLNFLTNTTTRATMTAGGTFQFLTAAPQTAIAPTTGDDLTNKTYVDGRITDVSNNLAALQLEVTDISGRVGTLETGLFDVSGRVASLETGLFDVSGRVATLEQQIIDVSGNIANWSLYPAVSTINADDNDIENVGSFTAGGILNSFQVGTALAPVLSAIVRATNLELTSYNPLAAMSIAAAGGINMTGADDINITANDVNISATGTLDILNLTAVAGIAINAGAGVEIGAVGTIQILSTGNVSIGSGNVLGADTEVEKFAFKDEVLSKAGVDDLELEDIAKINGTSYVPTQLWASQVATADVNFTEPSIPLPIVHNIVGLGKINGTTYAPTSQWSSFPAGSTVNMAGYSITNILDVSASGIVAGTTLSATNALTVGTLNYPEVNFAATLAVDVDATGQIVFQNKNTGPNASAAIFVIEGGAYDYMGIQVNSANYTSVDNTLFELPSAGIVSHTTDVVIGAGSDHSANARTYLTYSDGQAAYCLNEDGALSFDASYVGGTLNTGNFGTTGQLLVSQGSTAHPIYTSSPTVTNISVTGQANFGTGVRLIGDATQLLTLQEQGTTSLAQLRTAAINWAADTTDTDTVFFKRNDGYVGVIQGALTTRVAYTSDVMQQIAASFSSSATQTVTAANTPTRLTYSNTEYTKGGITYDVSGHIIVPTAGAYEIIISIQFDKTGGGVDVADFWFQLDDVDIPRSATQLVVAGTNGETVGTVAVILDLTAGQKVSTMIASADATMGATAFPAITTPYVRPAIPSIITCIKMITDPDGTPPLFPTPSPGPITISPGPALPTISMTQHVLTVPASTANIASATLTLGPVADGIFSVAGFSMSQNGTITQTGLAMPKVVTWSDGTDWFLNASVSNASSSASETWKVNVVRTPATIAATTNLITL